MKEFGDLHCAYVIFVSNMNKSVGLFAQIKGDSQMDHFVIWVVAIRISLTIVLSRTITFYRVIHGTDYVNHFSSDRSHMQRQDGSWIAPPPSYGCICGHNSSSSHNLPFYLDMTMNVVGENSLITDSVYGTVLNENEFFEKFSDL
ncbi:Protein N-terminal glutamine amidohydrolase [Schistosoma japonicum]|nr:Protein N-terminal glutamine amidohydrolase [Schistosoma japonicum]